MPSAPPLSPSEERFRDLFERLDAGFCIIEVRFEGERAADYRFLEVNPAFVAQTGLEDAVGKWMRELAPEHEQHWFDLYGHVALTGEPIRFENAAEALGRWYDVQAYRIDDPAERHVAILFNDISERRRAELALRESEARFRAMADSAPAPVWVTSAEGPIEFVNLAFAKLMDLPREALLGDTWIRLLHPDDLPAVAQMRARARAELTPYTFEARFRTARGVRVMQASSQPRLDDQGRFAGYVGIAVDVTDIRAAETRQQLLINELNHRVKNTLSTVQSLARQTLRDTTSMGEARRSFTDRLLALSAAHDVLTGESWQGAELRLIIEQTLRPYDALGPVFGKPRIRIEGESAWLAPNAALAISMALHELATNAAKYGALSAPEGEVVIRTSVREAEVEVVWTEQGGPPVKAPERTGFGLRLLQRGLATEFGSSAVIDFRPEGLVCSLTAPLPAALTSPSDSPT